MLLHTNVLCLKSLYDKILTIFKNRFTNLHFHSLPSFTCFLFRKCWASKEKACRVTLFTPYISEWDDKKNKNSQKQKDKKVEMWWSTKKEKSVVINFWTSPWVIKKKSFTNYRKNQTVKVKKRRKRRICRKTKCDWGIFHLEWLLAAFTSHVLFLLSPLPSSTRLFSLWFLLPCFLSSRPRLQASRPQPSSGRYRHQKGSHAVWFPFRLRPLLRRKQQAGCFKHFTSFYF